MDFDRKVVRGAKRGRIGTREVGYKIRCDQVQKGGCTYQLEKPEKFTDWVRPK